MPETLLSPSNVLLFGRVVADLEIVEPVVFPRPQVGVQVAVATTANVNIGNPVANAIDGVATRNGMRVLVRAQTTAAQNGLYVIRQQRYDPIPFPGTNTIPAIVFVRRGTTYGGQYFSLDYLGNVATYTGVIDRRHGPFIEDRAGLDSQVEQQLLAGEDPRFARIYGFSYEGFYYDLPRPALFLVHGDGYPASEMGPAAYWVVNRARAPGEPSLTGLGQADFQFSDDIVVWSYDKADYTIRMDVETGMFEQVLLDAMLDGGIDASGMNARGMNARGMNARGMNARGMNARGMNARGMNARGGGNSD
ncbi:MAG: hypothetical protein ABWY13_17480 [Mesorhizobium sp.]|jgi:hypothetical protein